MARNIAVGTKVARPTERGAARIPTLWDGRREVGK